MHKNSQPKDMRQGTEMEFNVWGVYGGSPWDQSCENKGMEAQGAEGKVEP